MSAARPHQARIGWGGGGPSLRAPVTRERCGVPLIGISPDQVASRIATDAEGRPTWWCRCAPGKVADVCRGNRHRVRQRVGLVAFAAAWALPALLGGVVACAGPGWPTAPAAVREQVQPATTSPETTTTRLTTAVPTSPETSSANPPTTRPYDSTSSTPPLSSAPATAPTTAPPTSTAVPVRPATPPAVVTTAHSPLLIGTAVVVLVAATGAVVLLVRRASRAFAQPSGPVPVRTGAVSVADAVVLMAELGEVMLECGHDVDSVQAAMADVAAVNGIPRAEIISLPTAMFASAQADGRLETSAVATAGAPLLLYQIEDVSDVVADARAGRTDPATARERIRAIRARPPVFGPFPRVVGNLLAAAGLAVLLGGAWSDVGVAAVLGGVVGMLLLVDVGRPALFG